MKTTYSIAGAILFLSFILPARFAFSQEVEQERKAFAGTVGITNKGVSQIPNFTLGKPAVQFYTRIGKRKLTFEPELRFATTGKPWDFVFRWQYRMLQTDKFRLRVALNSVLNFVTSSVTETEDEDNVQRDAIIARRFIGGQILPEYSLTKNLNIGMLFLYARGIEKSTLRNLNFIVFTTRLSNIDVFDAWTVTLNSQVYYLRIDERIDEKIDERIDERIDEMSGTYFSSSAVLAKRGFPFSLSAMINKSLHTDISGDDFLWSASVIYSY